MPQKREFRGILPTPQGVAKFTIRAMVLLFCAGILLVAAKFLWGYAFPAEVQAATPPPPSRAQSRTAEAAAPVAATLSAEQFEQLRADVCRSLGKNFLFEDGHCYKRKPPTWSAEGIDERGAPVGENIKKFFSVLPGSAPPAEDSEETPPPPRPAPRERAVTRMATESESWHPQLRLHGFLHEPGEPCPGGGHRDEYGLGCKFTDEEREELRGRR